MLISDKVIPQKLYTKSSHHTKLTKPLHAYGLGVKKWFSFEPSEQEHTCLQQTSLTLHDYALNTLPQSDAS